MSGVRVRGALCPSRVPRRTLVGDVGVALLAVRLLVVRTRRLGGGDAVAVAAVELARGGEALHVAVLVAEVEGRAARGAEEARRLVGAVRAVVLAVAHLLLRDALRASARLLRHALEAEAAVDEGAREAAAQLVVLVRAVRRAIAHLAAADAGVRVVGALPPRLAAGRVAGERAAELVLACVGGGGIEVVVAVVVGRGR